MDDLLRSGRLIDAILVVVVLEALVLALLPRFFPSLPRLSAFLPTLLSGAALMVALRFAVTDAPWTWVAGALLAALVAHLLDVRLRFRQVS